MDPTFSLYSKKQHVRIKTRPEVRTACGCNPETNYCGKCHPLRKKSCNDDCANKGKSAGVSRCLKNDRKPGRTGKCCEKPVSGKCFRENERNKLSGQSSKQFNRRKEGEKIFRGKDICTTSSVRIQGRSLFRGTDKKLSVDAGRSSKVFRPLKISRNTTSNTSRTSKTLKVSKTSRMSNSRMSNSSKKRASGSTLKPSTSRPVIPRPKRPSKF